MSSYVKVKWPGNNGKSVSVSVNTRNKANEYATGIIEDAIRWLDYRISSINRCTNMYEVLDMKVSLYPVIRLIKDINPYISSAKKRDEYQNTIEPFIEFCSQHYTETKSYSPNGLGPTNLTIDIMRKYTKEIVADVEKDRSLAPTLHIARILMNALNDPDVDKKKNYSNDEMRRILFCCSADEED